MTTIAYDGRYIAADTLMTFGNGSINQLPARKLVVRDGHVFASTGRIINGLRDRMVEWWLIPKDRIPSDVHLNMMPDHGVGDAATAGSLIIVLPDRRCGCVSYTGPDFLETGPISAWGSGEDYALGAIEAGANAMEAVLIAMRHDINTGGEVEFVDTHDLDSGVQRYCHPTGGMMHGSGNGAAASIRAAGGCPVPEVAPTLPDHVLINKPHAPAKSDTGANLWADACTGRLVLGNGCGECLRCNREWWAISKQSHEAVAPGVIRLTQDEVKASLARAPVVQPDIDTRDIKVKGFLTPPTHVGREPLQSSAWQQSSELPGDGRSSAQALLDHVDAWNTASAVGDEHRMKGLDIELRGLAFPPNVQVAIVGSPKRKVIINAPAQPQA